jgi:hypothetical protein
MSTSMLKYALVLGLTGALGLAIFDPAAAAPRKRYYDDSIDRPYVREPGCVSQYDSRGVPRPDYMNPNCENAFRRLYPPR